MSYKVYFISGLGADRRAFKKLVFPPDYELIHLDWITALHNESLEAYASRLALNIDTSTPFYLIGLSFGGMLATEITKNYTRYILSLFPVPQLLKNCPGITGWQGVLDYKN